MEKLIIENFAGIKSLEIDLFRINILIGPQASGKSVSAKLIFFFKTFFDEIRRGIENGKTKSKINSDFIARFIKYFPKENWSDEKFSIKYYINNSYFTIESKGDKKIKFSYSDDIDKIIKKARILINKERETIVTADSILRIDVNNNYKLKFNELIKRDLIENLVNNQVFIPAGRSFFSNIQVSIFSLLSSRNSIDPFLIEFGSYYENFKRLTIDDLPVIEKYINDKDINKIINSILNSNYIREKDKEYLLHNDNRKVSLLNASSGQQEILPLLIVLQILISTEFLAGGTTIYIEEPEAHLSPNAQKLVVKLLARVINSSKLKNQMVITTHSPYILSAFNNLMYAGYMSEIEGKSENVQKIVPPQELINPKDVSAYSLTQNREVISLIDSETHLIAQNILDDVSNEISIEFGKLLELE